MMENKFFIDDNIVWLLIEEDPSDILNSSSFMQDANCCFKISTKETPLEEGKSFSLISLIFDDNESAKLYTNNHQNDDSWDWDSDGLISSVFNGYALYIGTTAINGGNPETKESIENVLRCMK